MSQTQFVVMKFGGTSVASIERWNTIASEARLRLEEGLRPIVVCSAISGISDHIETILERCIGGNSDQAIAQMEEKHAELADALGVDLNTSIGAELTLIREWVQGAQLIGEVTSRLHARLMAMGELMSTKLGAAYLNQHGLETTWVDARMHLAAQPQSGTSNHRRMLAAECDFEPDPAIQDAFQKLPGVILTQGFIARDAQGETVLLGRGGSDTSAAYFAARLQAVRCEIWTDVPGMFTADPRQVPSARVLRALDFAEAQEIASMGAKVLHPRAIPPCKTHGIPMVVRCTPRPDLDGTKIQASGTAAQPGVKAISTRHGVMLVSMETVGMWQTVGFLADAFSIFKRLGLSIDLVSTSETNVTVSLDPSANSTDQETLNTLIRELTPLCDARVIGPCASISLVGRKIRAILHKLGGVLGLFEEQQIHLMTQAASDLNLTFVIDEAQSDRLVARLHAQLFGSQVEGAILGPTWDSMFDAASGRRPHLLDWWKERQSELLALADTTSPIFAINPHSVDHAAQRLHTLTAIDRRFYAIKANCHPDVLTRLHAENIGFECVSPGEIDHVRSLFPDLATERLLFTPNFAGPEEYQHGFDNGAMVTVDNLHPLAHWPEVFRGKEILLRIDPGKGRGHHAHVRTAGSQSKFGIAPDEIDTVAAAVEAAGTTVCGLHAHAGSGIRTPDGWAETAHFLAQVAQRFPDVRFLDLGGGLGIAEKPDQTPLDLNAVNASLMAFKETHPNFELWIEPGRFLIAHAGVLLAKVTQLKTKGEISYVGVNAGMNSLIRPALYGAYHAIVNLSRLDEQRSQLAHIVGPICETGDVLGHARRLAPTQEGDVILIGNTGAYGRSMASNYNLRTPAVEVMLSG
ncbi:MAG: bifunctional aspartate kinase/diaminopimelate decarboxylase [Myxococcota bacterium]